VQIGSFPAAGDTFFARAPELAARAGAFRQRIGVKRNGKNWEFPHGDACRRIGAGRNHLLVSGARYLGRTASGGKAKLDMGKS